MTNILDKILKDKKKIPRSYQKKKSYRSSRKKNKE